jgi:hypothetical protein
MRSLSKTEPFAALFNPRSQLSPPSKTHAHIEGFNNLVKYLVRLRREGTLADDDFAKIVKLASTLFIEAEFSNRVDSVLDDEKLNDILLGVWK